MSWPNDIGGIVGNVLIDMHNAAQTRPSNPTGITGATAKMLGLAVAYTPLRTGRILVSVSGNFSDDTDADVASFIARYGTGTAPSNGDASGGTAASVTRTWTAATGTLAAPFADTILITGLTIGTPIWIDYSAKATGAGAVATLTELSFVVMEI